VIDRADTGPLDDLLAAVQAFSNALADTPEQIAVVTSGLVVWDEMTFDTDGTPLRQTLYAAIGDQKTPTGSLGQALHLLGTLKRDIIGCDCT
jgi:hypothetical protein